MKVKRKLVRTSRTRWRDEDDAGDGEGVAVIERTVVSAVTRCFTLRQESRGVWGGEGRSLPPRGGKGCPRPYCFNPAKFSCVLL